VKCSCKHEFTASPDTFVGTQLFPSAAIALFNCPECHSTRGVCLAEADDEEQPIAAE